MRDFFKALFHALTWGATFEVEAENRVLVCCGCGSISACGGRCLLCGSDRFTAAEMVNARRLAGVRP